MTPNEPTQYVHTSRVIHGSPELHGLMQQCGYTDMGDFINAAINVLAWTTHHKQQGCMIGAMQLDDKQFIKLYHPALETAATKAQT